MKLSLTSALAFIPLFFVAGCGGGNDSGFTLGNPVQVISFGDSLSDVGTYEVNGSPPPGPLAFNGGRYTTNPGHVWTEIVSQRYGSTLLPAVRGGFGMAPVPTGGLGYAQGGSRVSQAVVEDNSSVLARPVASQVGDYLARYGKFNADQVILMNAGANDIINAVAGAYNGYIDPAAVPAIVTQAANDMADLLDRVTANGGQKIVLANVSDIGVTPLAVESADLSQDLSTMSALFNDVLLSRVNSRPRPRDLVLIDTYRWTGDMFANYRRNGFKVGNQDVACSSAKIIAQAYAKGLANPPLFVQQNGLALLCSATTLTEPDADQTYMFADELHPSTRLHALFAEYVIQRLDARGF